MHLVVARYNEDVSWLKDCGYSYTIYNKGDLIDLPCIQRPNVGRESETYLRYILDNYHHLSDIVAFLQGNPFDHCPNLLERLSQCPANKVELLGKDLFWSDGMGRPHHPGLLIDECLDKLIPGVHYETYDFVAGAQYAVPRQFIQNKSREWWQHIFDVHEELLTDQHRSAPWVFERLWPVIWGHSTQV